MSQDFLQIVKERGFVHQMTDEAGLAKLLKDGPQTAYIGFDCTAKSLHVGSLLQIMLLRWWQKTGHKPIVLLGGGTTKIGDPSGKDESRPPLTDAKIAENMAGIKTVFAKFLRDPVYVDNDEWLKGLNYVRFLRDYGRYFSVNRMLTMESVKLRLDRNHHLSFLEFNYMILQAYDFVELNKRYQCRVQMGGSDQWGNIINGLDLHKRLCQPPIVSGEVVEATGLSKEEAFKKSRASVDKEVDKLYEPHKIFGITSPLVTTANGAKMGKTADGAVWLNADMTSPYDYWQFWRNTDDRDVEQFLNLFTELEMHEIGMLMNGNINEAKKILATEATAMLHGKAEAEKAAATAAATFGGVGVSADLPEIIAKSTEASIIELLVQAEFAASNGEARRLIKGNGVSLNDAKVSDENAKLSSSDLAQGFAKLSAGKKRHVLVKVK